VAPLNDRVYTDRTLDAIRNFMREQRLCTTPRGRDETSLMFEVLHDPGIEAGCRRGTGERSQTARLLAPSRE
jgi:hypothetical protein